MRKLNKELKNRSLDLKKLVDYGFQKKENTYFYQSKIFNNQFEMFVVLKNKELTSYLIDLETNEEYILVDTNSTGIFTSKVKEEYEAKILDIIEKCSNIAVFKSSQAQEVINYIRLKYQDELEYLWEKFPENAIWRNKINNKWYGVILVLNENKLGIERDRIIEIIDLRYPKDELKSFVDNIKIFNGYHMNKDNWITIKLDGSVKLEEIFKLIDISYNLSLKK